MTYKTYTHKFIIKNSKEILENAYIQINTDSDNIIDLAESQLSLDHIDEVKKTIVVPGFINLHCHLAYYRVKAKPQKLFLWMKELYQNSFANKNYSPSLNTLDSLDEILKFGTTFIVDNSSCLQETFAAIEQKKLKALIGLEVFGSEPKYAKNIFEDAIIQIEKYENKNPNIDICLSPHAIYDVSVELWQKIIKWSRDQDKFVLSHISESEVEEFFTKNFADPKLKDAKEFWQSIDSLEAKQKHWQSYKSSVDFLKVNDLLYENLVLAHGVHCSDEDLQILKDNSIKLVNCPRSNAYLQNGIARTEKWQELGIDFAMGTDSKSSNQDLDLRKELKTKNHLSSREKFDKITIDAARILKQDHKIGSLEKGKSADFVVLELLDKKIEITKDNIFDYVIDPNKTQVKEVYINGEKVL